MRGDSCWKVISNLWSFLPRLAFGKLIDHSCGSPQLCFPHSGWGIKVAAAVSLNIHIGQLSPGTRATGGIGGVVTRRLLLLQHDILAECAQTIYFGSDWLSTGCWTRIISFTGWVWSAVIHPRNINNATVKACFTRKAVYGVVWYDRCVVTRRTMNNMNIFVPSCSS